MPRLDGTGPEGDGSQTGRQLGLCKDVPGKEKLEKLGKGTGARRKSGGGGGEGKGKRFKSGKP